MALLRVSKPKKLNGRTYKELLKSLAKRYKGSDRSIKEKDTLSPNSQEDENSSPDTQRERMDFLLRRVRTSDHGERSNSSSQATQTNLQERKKNISASQCNQDISKVKEKSAHCVAFECKSTTTNFLEYWVPVKLSDVQTEQYCGSLFSNARLLCSSVKHDSTNFLHDILVSTRKCCDHPYLVDGSLRTSLIQGIPQPGQLDAEIELSNKLLLLHKILLEVKKRGLRVLILYQSIGGSGLITTGDILDDIIHEKFGGDSFVRIGGGLSRSKKRTTLNTFNDKGSGKFVCLMETRACLPSVKLASIDTVILFNSDWDPVNDLRALQKINLDSQFEQVKVFRLYSSYTVEEKLLILTKQGIAPEGNAMTVKQSTCHGLLSWGASHLFKKLDEFHKLSAPDKHSIISNEDSFVEDVFLELSTLLPNSEKSDISRENSLILEVQQIGGVYPENISLLGEVESPLMDNLSLAEETVVKETCVFWTKLLKGRNPRWKYFSRQSPRNRKSVQRFDDLPEVSSGAEPTPKKCRTEATSTDSQIPTAIRRKRRNTQRKRSGGKENYPVRRKIKYISIQSDLREKMTSCIKQQSKAAALTRVHAQTLDNPSSAEHHSVLPPNEHDDLPSSTTMQNGHNVNAGPSFRNQAATPLANCQPPEASQETQSEALQSVCKALQLELERLEKERGECLRRHEDMKQQTKMACEKEIDEIRKKYDTLLQDAETTFAEEKEVLDTRYNKVYINKSLAEAMLQSDDSINATLSEAEDLQISSISGCLVAQESKQASASARIDPRPTQSFVSPCPTAVLPALSSEAAIFQPPVAARPNQPLVNPCTNDQQLLPRLPTTFSSNLQAGYHIRAPAPHLQHMRRPLSLTTPKISSPSSGVIFAPVNLNVQARPSPGLTSFSSPSPAGLLL